MCACACARARVRVCERGPTLHQVVLEEGGADRDPPPGPNGAHGLGDVGRLVLQDVALVTDHKVWTCRVRGQGSDTRTHDEGADEDNSLRLAPSITDFHVICVEDVLEIKLILNQDRF